jgi:hypothetical protein
MLLVSTPPYDDPVRLSLVRVFPAQKPICPPKALRPPTPIPLCDLCAMLCPTWVFPAQKLICPPKSFAPSNLRSPSVTSVRCFPRGGCFPPRSHAVHQKALHPRTSIPLCDLCAMLFPDARLSRPEAMLSTKNRRTSIPLFKFETSKISSHVRSRSPVFYRDFFGRNPERGRCEWRFPEEAGQRNRQRFLLCLFL